MVWAVSEGSEVPGRGLIWLALKAPTLSSVERGSCVKEIAVEISINAPSEYSIHGIH